MADALSPAPRRAAGIAGDDIAIVGMACCFPRAATPADFWQNIVERIDCIGAPTPDWQPEQFTRHVYVARGGFLGELSRFDPAKYGIMPSSIEGAEPDQFLAFACALDALADAGVPEIPLDRERTGVIIGRGIYINRGLVTMIAQSYVVDEVVGLVGQLEPNRSVEDLELIRSELRRVLPPFSAETVPGLTHNILAGRVANKLDLKGPAYTVDAACSSTLLAVDHATAALRDGECSAVVVGGVQVTTPGMVHMAFCYLDALSREGKIAPFSSEASGTLLGQGCGMLVLKRREDALRDGNRIYALIKSVALSSDGRGSGILATQQAGQELALRRAYKEAAVDPATVGLVEAHGTGIPLGDATEVKTLGACFPSRQGDRPHVALGSVKSMIGHLLPASGAASLIKTALSLYHRVLPPTLNAEHPNPELGLDQTPFYLSTATRPWVHGDRATPRRAGVNAFGFGGINAHAILEEDGVADETTLPRLERRWPAELVVVSAQDREALARRAEALADWVRRAGDASLLDVAAACAAQSGPSRLAVVARDLSDLAKKLSVGAARLRESDRTQIQDRGGIFWYAQPQGDAGRVAFVFPGEGAQYTSMLGDLCRNFSEVRRQFDLTDEAFAQAQMPVPLSRLIFPLPEEAEAAEAELWNLGGAVTSVTLASRALLALLGTLKLRADAIVGHSSGEFGALIAAGAIAPADDDALVAATAAGALNAAKLASSGLVPPAVLIAVGGANPDAVERVLAESKGKLVVAMENCPSQRVLVGDESATAAALEGLRGQGGLCERLPWDRAYHTPDFAPAVGIIEEYFDAVDLRGPRIETWSCATVDRYPQDPAGVKELAVRQWSSPVRFRETIEAMYTSGVRVFVEVGPRGNLSAFVADTLGKQPHAAVPLDVPRRDGLTQLCWALGMLAAHNVFFDLPALYARRQPRPLELNAAPPEAPRPQPPLRLDLPRLALGEETVSRLRESQPAETTPAQTATAATATPAPTAQPTPQLTVPVVTRSSSPLPAALPSAEARSQAIADYQQTMRQFIHTQQQVLLARLKATPAETAPVPEVAKVAATPAASAPAGTSARADISTATPAPATVPQTAPVNAASTSDAVAVATTDSGSCAGTTNLQSQLLDIVSQRTGYPVDMLDLDAQLESDLGIDSIKRVEVIGAFRRAVMPGDIEPPADVMEELAGSQTLRAVLEGFRPLLGSNGSDASAAVESNATATTTPDANTHHQWPLLETILVDEPGARLVAECELDARRHGFLRDHTFLGRGLSLRDPQHMTLPVMPMAMTLEMMAEAALRLFPQLQVVALEDVQTHRWLAMETETRRLRVEARAVDPTRAQVQVFEADREGFSSVVTEGTVELADSRLPLGPPQVPDRATGAATWAKDIYGWILFHGPAFQGVERVEAADVDAIRAIIHAPNPQLLFAGDTPPLVIRPALLDVAIQVPGMIYGQWDVSDPEVHMVFPHRFARLEIGPDEQWSREPLRAIATTRREDNDLFSDLEVKNEAGDVVLRMQGRVCQVVDFPTGLHHYSKAPQEVTCCRRLTGLFDDIPGGSHCTLVQTGTAGSRILSHRLWSHAVTRMVLSRREQQALTALKLAPAALGFWLAGRMAAKDAVRLHLAEQNSDEKCYMADVEIIVDEAGKPHIELGNGANPLVSITHKDFAAVAVAADPQHVASVGIDMEALGTMDEGLKQDATTPRERELFAQAASANGWPLDHWHLAAWAAKEALGKALGRGVLGGPLAVEVESIDATSGQVVMQLRNRMAEAFPNLVDRPLTAYCRRHDDYCVALCLLESQVS